MAAEDDVRDGEVGHGVLEGREGGEVGGGYYGGEGAVGVDLGWHAEDCCLGEAGVGAAEPDWGGFVLVVGVLLSEGNTGRGGELTDRGLFLGGLVPEEGRVLVRLVAGPGLVRAQGVVIFVLWAGVSRVAALVWGSR